jgi:hypothetical protein
MKLDKSYKNIGVQRLFFNGVKVSASGSERVLGY